MPDSLFYFTPIRGADRKKWLEELIVEHKVYFRSRDQLNDPNELRPSIVFEGTEKEIRTFVRHLILRHWPIKLSPAERLRRENELIYKYRHYPAQVEETLHATLDRIGLLCLSESSTEPLLWAHYADGHRGLAVEFDANAGLFVAAQRVKYSNEAPVINRVVDGPDEILEKSMFTKGKHWEYEKEWRVIARWRDADRIEQYVAQHNVGPALERFMRDQHGAGYYDLAQGAIRSLVFGSNLPDGEEAWIRTLLARAPDPIQVRRAALARNGMVVIGNEPRVMSE